MSWELFSATKPRDLLKPTQSVMRNPSLFLNILVVSQTSLRIVGLYWSFIMKTPTPIELGVMVGLPKKISVSCDRRLVSSKNKYMLSK